jgi:soluble lytic murein transglycosylase
MEKRSQKTLTLTLACGAHCAKWSLALTLFLPALSPLFVSHTRESVDPVVSRASAVEEIQRPKELVQIFSIVRSHRQDAAESEIWRLSEVIHEETSKRHLDPLMVLALIRVESRFQPDAVSPAGARGIMQIMPDTGKNLAGEYGFHSAHFTTESLDDPVLNLRLGIYYLHGLKSQFQNWSATLTAYNFGPIDTQNRIDNNLDLSGDFAALVLDAYRRYKNARHPAF